MEELFVGSGKMVNENQLANIMKKAGYECGIGFWYRERLGQNAR